MSSLAKLICARIESSSTASVFKMEWCVVSLLLSILRSAGGVTTQFTGLSSLGSGHTSKPAISLQARCMGAGYMVSMLWRSPGQCWASISAKDDCFSEWATSLFGVCSLADYSLRIITDRCHTEFWDSLLFCKWIGWRSRDGQPKWNCWSLCM